MKCKVCDSCMIRLLNNNGYVCTNCGYVEKPEYNSLSYNMIRTLSELKQQRDEFNIGDIVQHFKRETITDADDSNKYLYVIRGFAKHTETGENLVIYQALYSPFETFARPIDMFYGKVDKNKYPNIKQEFRLERYL